MRAFAVVLLSVALAAPAWAVIDQEAQRATQSLSNVQDIDQAMDVLEQVCHDCHEVVTIAQAVCGDWSVEQIRHFISDDQRFARLMAARRQDHQDEYIELMNQLSCGR